MKDLQELFESMGTKDFQKLVDMEGKKNLSNKSVKHVLDLIAKVYCAEKEVEDAEITGDDMRKLMDDFFTNLALYQNILIGHMFISSGRIKLTDGECQFSLTPAGIAHVENMIGK